jgi:hypothetical protein
MRTVSHFDKSAIKNEKLESKMKVAVPKHCISHTDPTKDLTTKDLLNWISDVTIKRRQIRKTTRCSNLVAEAILSSALRKAKKELAVKQEERMKKIKRFCRQFDATDSSEIVQNQYDSFSKSNANADHYHNNKCTSTTDNSLLVSNVNSNNTWAVVDSDQNSLKYSCAAEYGKENQEDIDSCLVSLEAFFNDLKSVKA